MKPPAQQIVSVDLGSHRLHVEVAGAGSHWVHVDTPEVFLEATERFLEARFSLPPR